MLVTENLKINERGHLTMAGCDTTEIAATYGTPLYVMDEEQIRRTLGRLKGAIEESCPNGGRVAYAGKACCFKEMYRIVDSEGCGADVVSCGEMYTALQAGFPAEKLYYHGNNKTDADLTMALQCGVGRIVVDNPTELTALSEIATQMGVTARVFLRITPGIDAHTHSFIKTGQIDSKFGFTLETGEALSEVKRALSLSGIELKGLHCHVASQIFDEEPFRHAAEVMLAFMYQIREETGVTLTELDLGGGFGIAYKETDHPKPCYEYMRLIGETLTDCAAGLGFPVPYIIVEPGRSVAAPAGLTLYTVGSVKRIPNVRTYVSVDGGMTDNPRYALYQAPYTVVAAARMTEPATEEVTISGHCCESGDLLQEGVPLPSLARGDLLAVLTTGAYNYSMSSNYNRFPKPAVVMLRDGKSRVVVKAETLDDVLRNDV